MITVLTPTYNRAYTLLRLYKSLLNQDSMNFEWLIVDDGSSDDTKKIIDSFILDNKINIKYIYQENKGKPQALNYGILNASGEFVFIVDSDDYLLSNAISLIFSKIKEIDSNNIEYSGLCFRRGYSDGRLIGEVYEMPVNYFLLKTATELKNDTCGDLAYCLKKEELLKNLFPYFNFEKFVPELYIWNKITDINKVVCFLEDIIYVGDYLEDGLTANFKEQLKNNPNGFLLYYKDQFFREKKLVNKLKMLIRAIQCTFYAKSK